jgi:hypothetical protein
MELTVEYIPALIVAKRKDGSYIKISESKNDEIYFCPVCGGEVKSRAVDSNKVQPHFYHTTETNCSNESILHWMFKNWLFEVGSKFIIEKDEFIVNKFEMEEPIETPFGEYRPDLSICTDKEDFYFEINYSSGKDKTFADKWSYLGKRVIEVNVRELINSELYETTPIFKTIFADGKYTKEYKTYEKKDKYVEFKTFVLDSKTEDNIKEVAEKFDWFWKEISKDKEDNNIINSLECMDYSDGINCTKFLKKIKCHNKFKLCKDKMLERAYSEIKEIINDEDYFVDINKTSAQIYELTIYQIISNVKVCCDSYKIRTFDGTILYKELKDAYDKTFESIKDKANRVKKELEEINKIKIKGVKKENIEKIITVSNYSGYRDKDYNINLIVNVFSEVTNTWDRVYNYFYNSRESVINDASHELSKIESRFLEEKRKDESCVYWDTEGRKLAEEELFKISKDIKFISSEKHVKAMIGDIQLTNFNSEVMDLTLFTQRVKESIIKFEFLQDVLDKINNCKNNFWRAKLRDYRCDVISICIKGLNEEKYKGWEDVYYRKEEDFFESLVCSMKSLMYPMDNMRARYSWFKENNLNYITINTERNGLHEQK